MALSNMLREPRREITETVVGLLTIIATVTPLGWLDWRVSAWATASSPPNEAFIDFVFWLVLIVPVSSVAAFGVLILIHAVGEGVCNAFQLHGIDLRPRRRY